MSDIEHDSHEDYGGPVGTTPKLPPEPSDTELDKLDATEALTEKRKRQPTILPTVKAMLARRYYVRPEKEERRLEAENAEWLSLDNDELFTEL